MREGGSGCFPLPTPLFHTCLENEDQGQRGGVTETELGGPGTAGQARMPTLPCIYPPAAAGAPAGHADLTPGECHRLASLCPAESTHASHTFLRPPCS